MQGMQAYNFTQFSVRMAFNVDCMSDTTTLAVTTEGTLSVGTDVNWHTIFVRLQVHPRAEARFYLSQLEPPDFTEPGKEMV